MDRKVIKYMKDLVKKIYHMIVPWGDTNKKMNKIIKKMNMARERGNKIASGYYCHKLEKKYQCRITPGSVIGKNLRIPHPNGITIGHGSRIGNDVLIYQQVTIGQNQGKYPTIGDNVIIYAGAKIIGGIRIGNNCIIGANAVVTKSFPANCIIGGVPAKKIKNRGPEDRYK